MNGPLPHDPPHGTSRQPRSVGCAVLTVSDTRTEETDRGGPVIVDLLTADGHRIVARAIVRDEPAEITRHLETWIADAQIQAVMLTGGTGISRRDHSVDTVRPLLDLELDGFGELFRMLSYHEVGSIAVLSRATAGLVCREPEAGGDMFVFVLPGSPHGVRLAMEKLIVPELRHLVGERRR